MNDLMKRSSVLLFVLLLSVGGCGGKKKRCVQPCAPNKDVAKLNMPVASQTEDVVCTFDDDIAEFALVDDIPENTHRIAFGNDQEEMLEEDLTNEFSWIDEDEERRDTSFKAVYFDFDRYAIKPDQESSVTQNVEIIKKKLAECSKAGKKATVVIEGNACSAAGSAAYNMALSEKRAKVLADRLVSAGISRSHVKIVGRGQECPAVVNGQAVYGNRQQQWLNRRDEINVINA